MKFPVYFSLLWLSAIAIMVSLIESRSGRMNVAAFTVAVHQLERHSTLTSPTILLARKKKPSMAEKRAARSKRRSARPDVFQLPKSKVATELKQPQRQPTTPGMTVNESVTQKIIQDRKSAATSEQSTEATKAQLLVQAQKESVSTLTAVKAAVEQLPVQEIQEALSTTGFWYGDTFLLNDNNNNNQLFSKLQKEGQELLPSMEKQSDELVSGEYTVAIQGGQEQYKICPRSIEWVVSVTKHLPVLLSADGNDLNNNNNNNNEDYKLSATNCMATMRTFDRKALEASLELVIASSGAGDAATATTTTTDVEAMIDETKDSSRPFEMVVSEPKTDLRRLSLCYYLVPTDWKEEYGGGLSFLSGINDQETTTIAAQRDRLVIWKSDKTRVRKNPWKGHKNHPLASCIELDLVASKN